MKIAIGNDHAAINLKHEVIKYLKQKNITTYDFGVQEGQKVDYPDNATKVCSHILTKEYDYGILLCGTGVGMSIAANKIRGIRAVVCSEPYSAMQSRAHNDANVLCIGARVVGDELAKMIVDAFVGAAFEGGRHAQRVAKIGEIEGG